MSSTVKTRKTARLLAWGDAACIVLFAIIGLQSHGEPVSLSGIVRNALPILLVWWLIAPFLRTYTRPTWQNLLYTWAIAVSTGVWLRFMVLQKSFDTGYLVFWTVSLTTTLLLLLLWRFAAHRILHAKEASLG